MSEYSFRHHKPHGKSRRSSNASVVSCGSGSTGITCTSQTDSCDDPKPTGIMQTIDNLTVGNLFTGKQLGSTLVLTGNGNRCRNGLSDTALCVRSGARITGHTVANTIQMSGNLSTTEGVTCNRADVGASDGFTVNRIPAGPFNVAQVLSAISPVIVTKGAAGAKKMMLGTPVSSTGLPATPGFIVVPLVFEGSATTFTTADTDVCVEVGEIQHAMKVVCVSVSANIALLSFAEGTPSKVQFIPIELDRQKQLPARGSPVVVLGADTTQGIFTSHRGTVSQPCTNMVYESTHLIVSLDGGTLSKGSIGGPILSLEQTLLSIISHGTPASSLGGVNPVYSSKQGGLRAPFIKYVIDTYLQSLTSPVELPCLKKTLIQVLGRQIAATDRTPLFKTGGILESNYDGLGHNRQLLSLNVYRTGNPIPVNYPLGTLDVNVPSLPDSLLDAYSTYGSSGIDSVDLVYSNDIVTSTYPPSGSDFPVTLPQLGTSTYWSAGSPFNSAYSMTTSATQTDFLVDSVPNALSFFSTSFTCAFDANSTGSFQHSNTSTSDVLLYVFWGIFGSGYTGVGGNHGVISELIQYAPSPAAGAAISAAWTAAQASWSGTPPAAGDYVITVLCPTMPALSILQVVSLITDTFTVLTNITGTITAPTLDLSITGTSGVTLQTVAGVPCSKLYEGLSFLVGPTTPPTMDLITDGTFTFIGKVTPAGGGGNVTPCTVTSPTRVYV